MWFKNFLKKISFVFKKYNILISFCLAIWGLWATLCPPSQNPHLIFNYKAFDLVNVNENNKNLKVYFNGQDIQKEKLNLKVYSVTLKNDGSNDVKPTDYDISEPFGIQVKNGFVTGCEVLSSDDAYMKNKFYSNKILDSTKIVFNRIILKSKKSIEFKFTVLHKDNAFPKLKEMGEIANTSIDIVEGENEETDWLGLLQVLAIFGFSILGFILFVTGLDKVVGFCKRSLRKMTIKNKYGRKFDNSNANHRLIAEIYSTLGKKQVKDVLSILIDQEKLNQVYFKEKKDIEAVDIFSQLYKEKRISSNTSTLADIKYISNFFIVIELIREDKLITENEGHVSINAELLEEIKVVLDVLELN
ncbi:MAG: hypothetical protein Q8K60_03420 [Parachlamydiaceae bacterium]|nr:hypothetical protein [Parachlamydiaceae bacterium]